MVVFRGKGAGGKEGRERRVRVTPACHGNCFLGSPFLCSCVMERHLET
jgi:hypothetical protein